MSVNKVIVLGRLGKNPEVRIATTGNAVAKFTVATNRPVKRNEQWEEVTEWHNIVVFGKLAEQCDKLTSKGKLICIEGRLETESWDKDGCKHYKTNIIAEKIDFVERN